MAVLSVLLTSGSIAVVRWNAWIAFAVSLLNFACAVLLVLLPGMLERAGGYMAIYLSVVLIFSITCLVIAAWPPRPQVVRRAPVHPQYPATDMPDDRMVTAVNPIGWLNMHRPSPDRDRKPPRRRSEARRA